MATEKKITLKAPVQFGSESVSELVMTRKLKYLRGYSLRVTSDGKGSGAIDLDFSTLIDLSAKMIGRSPAFIDEVDEDDQAVLLQEARDFLLKHLGGGSQE
ncbi:phage tail assembly protein [Pseudomonas sp. SZMC_28357]|uniref:phage tail assembly protein n=1 Tax=Pseudomonas sp. SZMC_28357 TaxID=3074380 RepID=UPI0028723E41|nr:phage tail assembly protein [Pseudomonas sp. SZMC_28357]MDR9749846.1 phage tail assembly protein [Pseudomonas sp. SZMC_28357]